VKENEMMWLSTNAVYDRAQPNSFSATVLPPLFKKFYEALALRDSLSLAAFAGTKTAGAFTLNPYVFPIMECVTSVASAVGRDIGPYAAELVHTCLGVIYEVYREHERALAQQLHEHNDVVEPPSKDFVVCSLDVISGCVTGLQSSFVPTALCHSSDVDMSLVFMQQLLRTLCDEDYPGRLCDYVC
jgi:hypothetical protein